MRQRRWLIVGGSNISKQYMIPSIAACTGQDVGILLSRFMEPGDYVFSGHSVKVVNKLSDLELENFDCAYVGGRNERRFSDIHTLLSAGINVLADKPLCLSLEEAYALKELAHASGRVLAVNHHLRTSNAITKVKEIIDSGQLGAIRWVKISHAVMLPPHLRTWRVNDSEAGGVVLDISNHDFDLLNFLFRPEIESICSCALHYERGIPSGVASVIKLKRDVLVIMHESFESADFPTRLEIQGEQGAIEALGVLTQEPVGTIQLRKGLHEEAVSFNAEPLYVKGIEAFVAALDDSEKQPLCTIEDGIWALRQTLQLQSLIKEPIK